MFGQEQTDLVWHVALPKSLISGTAEALEQLSGDKSIQPSRLMGVGDLNPWTVDQ